MLGLVLLIVSFFTRDKMLIRWAGITFALILIQSQLLPELGRQFPIMGALHGLNALLLFTAAIVTRSKAKAPAPVPEMSMAT